MGDVHYIKDLRGKIRLTEPPLHDPLRAHRRECLLDQATFESIGDYTRSQPTGPKAGVIYRKNYGWPADMDDNWFIFIVVDEPAGTAPVCPRCRGRKRIRFVGREMAQDCDHCGGSGSSKPGQLHVPYSAVVV